MVKNEPDFLNFLKVRSMELLGEYGFPKIRGIHLKHPEDVKLLGFNYATNPKTEDKDKLWVHFYLPDYRFQQVWNNPQRYVEIFKQYRGIVSPDFSVYVGMPKAMQLFQVYRMAFMTAYYQQYGIKVIPSVTWAEPDTFDWCFSWIPRGSAVVVSTVGCVQNKSARKGFLYGFEEMLKRVEPSEIVFYGHEIPEATQMWGGELYRVPDLMEVRKKTVFAKDVVVQNTILIRSDSGEDKKLEDKHGIIGY